jgi:hypothetical protein
MVAKDDRQHVRQGRVRRLAGGWNQREDPHARAVGQQMPREPGQEQTLVEFERCRRMIMAAWAVSGGAARVENGLSILRRQAGQVELLESGGRDARNRRPVGYAIGGLAQVFAIPSIRLDVLELEANNSRARALKFGAGDRPGSRLVDWAADAMPRRGGWATLPIFRERRGYPSPRPRPAKPLAGSPNGSKGVVAMRFS